MKSEKSQKHVAKKKDTEPAPSGFGSFLSGAVSHLLAEGDTQPSTPEIDWESMERAVKRRRQERERDERLERLERREIVRKRAANTSRKSLLWRYVAEVKRNLPAKRSDHAFIARGVDVILEREKRRLSDVCPKSWRKVPGLPSLLQDARLYGPLKGRVKTFISKVEVS
jgi:hypothetical protein